MTSREGRLTIEGDRAVLTFERRLPYPINAVWSAITDPAHRNRYLGSRVALVTRQLNVGRAVTPVASFPAAGSAPAR